MDFTDTKRKVSETMKKTVFPILLALLGLLILLTPLLFAPSCPPMPDGKFMKCHWSSQAEIGYGVAVMVLAFLAFMQNSKTRKGLYQAEAVFAALVLATPSFLIGSCPNHNMACNTSTNPMLYGLGIALLFVSLLALFLEKERKEG